MRAQHPEETRADIARRRLAELAASFEARLPPALPPSPGAPPEPAPEPGDARRRLDFPHVKVLAVVAVAASVLLAWWMLSGRPHTTETTAPLAFATTPSGTAAPSTPQTADLVVDVVGKVRKPGIVTVPPGSRVYQAIEAAGGLKGTVDTASLNMARRLTDGEQILVGIEPALAAAPPGGTGTGGGASAKVNLNTATAEQLDTLPGVGPVTAQAILGWRKENGRFGSVDDLLEVKGIGEATLAELRDLVTV